MLLFTGLCFYMHHKMLNHVSYIESWICFTSLKHFKTLQILGSCAATIVHFVCCNLVTHLFYLFLVFEL